ncbi:unnamed protein product [Rhizoctonia solani]|uniref:Uncharacterized protein n=1 Tax=Rhizoctonia solani TaxID=456999 RepID=A0A8H2WA11_9AGAM|nr:unnamed protein product [Rhizoctonia solani]
MDVLYMKLIGAVVDAPDPKVKKSIKGKGKEKAKESTGPQSLLAQTVQERAPPKRRGRRVEPGPSALQPVGDTHKVILKRGAALLGVSPVPNLKSQPDVIPETWEERPEMKEADEEDPEMKEEANEEQPEMKEDVDEEEPEMKEDEPIIPATQSFAPSKIGGRSRLFGTTSATLNMDSRSGLFYADLPCMVSPASETRSLSTLE